MTQTYGDVLKKYGTWENYRKTPEGILSSINACKSLIEDEKEKLVEIEQLYFMGEPLEEINKQKNEVAKSIEFFQNKIKLLLNQLKNT